MRACACANTCVCVRARALGASAWCPPTPSRPSSGKSHDARLYGIVNEKVWGRLRARAMTDEDIVLHIFQTRMCPCALVCARRMCACRFSCRAAPLSYRSSSDFKYGFEVVAQANTNRLNGTMEYDGPFLCACTACWPVTYGHRLCLDSPPSLCQAVTPPPYAAGHGHAVAH